MSLLHRTLVVLFCVTLTGCAAGTGALDHERRLVAVNQSRDIPTDYRTAILDGRVLIGMSEEMVAASWGIPNHAGVESRGTTRQDIWEYGPRAVPGWGSTLTFEDETLVSIERNRSGGFSALWEQEPTTGRIDRGDATIERSRSGRELNR